MTVDKSSLDYQFGRLEQILADQNRALSALKDEQTKQSILLSTVVTHSALRDGEVASDRSTMAALTADFKSMKKSMEAIAGDRKMAIAWGAGALAVLTVFWKFGWAIVELFINKK